MLYGQPSPVDTQNRQLSHWTTLPFIPAMRFNIYPISARKKMEGTCKSGHLEARSKKYISRKA